MVDGDSQQLMVNGNVLKTPLALSVSKGGTVEPAHSCFDKLSTNGQWRAQHERPIKREAHPSCPPP
jgi:hypothetical protein